MCIWRGQSSSSHCRQVRRDLEWARPPHRRRTWRRQSFYLVTGQYQPAHAADRDEFLAAVGAALVFLIDWNRHRHGSRRAHLARGAGGTADGQALRGRLPRAQDRPRRGGGPSSRTQHCRKATASRSRAMRAGSTSDAAARSRRGPKPSSARSRHGNHQGKYRRPAAAWAHRSAPRLSVRRYRSGNIRSRPRSRSAPPRRSRAAANAGCQ